MKIVRIEPKLIRAADSSHVANMGKFLVAPLLAVDGTELNMDRVREWTFQ
jgi:hypothetical protein